jgi:ABC-2 type transport system permease protein
MRLSLSKAWIVAAKDLKIFTKKKAVARSVVLFPLVISIALPLVIDFAVGRKGSVQAVRWSTLIDAFSFFFVIIAAYLPTAIAAYSLIGEKVEKSLEPLLATPTTDGELLLGKNIAGFIPPVAAIYISSFIFMALMDALTRGTLGYLAFPNWSMAVILLVVVPLATIMSIEGNVMISARASDVRSAQLQGGLMVLPFAALYVTSEVGVVTLTVPHLFIISAVILLIDVILFFLSTKTFQREEILTKWA